MGIGREFNGHWTGDQWALDSDSMGIGLESNAHWISIQCPLDLRVMGIGFQSDGHWPRLLSRRAGKRLRAGRAPPGVHNFFHFS